MTDAGEPRATGSCLCGAVRFAIYGAMRDVTYCHCAMCQRALTHFGAFTACAPEDLSVTNPGKLKWYRSSPEARRGFCKNCGSQLFWEPAHRRHISISAGSLDQPTGLRPGKHIHLGQIADYDRAGATLGTGDEKAPGFALAVG
jgi:hypothetical protein